LAGNTKTPEAKPLREKQGEVGMKSVLAGSGSDLSRIEASVVFFRQPQASKNSLVNVADSSTVSRPGERRLGEKIPAVRKLH
jgi:hypothetical protein